MFELVIVQSWSLSSAFSQHLVDSKGCGWVSEVGCAPQYSIPWYVLLYWPFQISAITNLSCHQKDVARRLFGQYSKTHWQINYPASPLGIVMCGRLNDLWLSCIVTDVVWLRSMKPSMTFYKWYKYSGVHPTFSGSRSVWTCKVSSTSKQLLREPSVLRPSINPWFQEVGWQNWNKVFGYHIGQHSNMPVRLAASLCTAYTKCSTTGVSCTWLSKWEGGCVNNYDA